MEPGLGHPGRRLRRHQALDSGRGNRDPWLPVRRTSRSPALGAERALAAGAVALLAAVSCLACTAPERFELRRALHASDPSRLLSSQREALGCDPCVQLELDPAMHQRTALVGPARADASLLATELLGAEIYQHRALRRGSFVYDLMLVVAPQAQPRLSDLRASHPRARFALLVDGLVIGVTTPAVWPDHLYVARFREPEPALQLAKRLGIEAVSVPPGD